MGSVRISRLRACEFRENEDVPGSFLFSESVPTGAVRQLILSAGEFGTNRSEPPLINYCQYLRMRSQNNSLDRQSGNIRYLVTI